MQLVHDYLLGIQTARHNKKLAKFGFRTHTTALWAMEQSFILSAKFDCPVARQNLSLFATAHDCETDLSYKQCSLLFTAVVVTSF